MKLLINKNTLRKYVQIAHKRNDDIIEQAIRTAQTIDLPNLLCEEYYSQLITKPEEFQELIQGGEYEVDGVTYINHGLEIVLSYLAYANYKMHGSNVDTPFGTVVKTTDDSDPATKTSKQIAYTLNKQYAMTYLNNVRKFLIRTNYKGYNDICGSCKPNTVGFRISVIKNENR